MDSRKTLFLITLVGIVGAFVVWDHFKGTPTEVRVAKIKRLIDIDAKEVNHVQLVRSNQTIILEKAGDNWELKQPVLARGDSGAVSAFLDELEFAERTRLLAESDLQGVSLKDFGLQPPRLTIKLAGKKGPIALHIGTETPTKDGLYAQVEGQKSVCVTHKFSFIDAIQTADSFRSRTAIEFTPAAVTRLEIKTADRLIELIKSAATTNAESRWMLTRPLNARADQNKISEFLSDLSGLRIQSFVSDEPKDVHTYRLEEPEHEVTIHTGESDQTLLLGHALTNDPAQVYAKLKTGNSIFTVSAEPVKKVAVQVNDLRDPRLLVFNPLDVKGVEIVHGADKVALQGDGKDWALTAPVAVAADSNAVRSLLGELAGLRVKQFTADVATDLAIYGLAAPSMTVTLQAVPGVQLRIGSLDTSNGVRFVKRADEPFIYGVDTNAIDHLPASYAALRSRVVFDLKPELITKLMAGPVTLLREQGKWKLVEPTQGVLDVDAVNAVVQTFAKLRADAYVPSADRVGAKGYLITASFGDTNHWLSVAKDGQVTASSVELTFQVPLPIVDMLTKKLVSESKPEPPAPVRP